MARKAFNEMRLPKEKHQKALDKRLLSAVKQTDSRPEDVAMFLNAGANPNAKTFFGTPYLIRALKTKYTKSFHYQSRVDIVEAFIKAGADVNARDTSGNTPLMTLLEKRRGATPEIMKRLVNAGADIDAVNKKGVSAMDIAESYLDPELSRLLKELQPPPPPPKKRGRAEDLFLKPRR